LIKDPNVKTGGCWCFKVLPCRRNINIASIKNTRFENLENPCYDQEMLHGLIDLYTVTGYVPGSFGRLRFDYDRVKSMNFHHSRCPFQAQGFSNKRQSWQMAMWPCAQREFSSRSLINATVAFGWQQIEITK